MYIAKTLLKTRDKVNKFSRYIPLISDIDDANGVLMEHHALNYRYDTLKFALVLMDGKYYFIDVENAIAENKYITDNKQFTCPCCLQDLFTRGNHVKRINGKDVKVSCSFNHYKHSKDCEFKTGYNSKYVDDEFIRFGGEKYDHKFLKVTTCAIANAGHMYIKIPESYEIIENEEDYTCKAKINYSVERIVKAEPEKQRLKKDAETDGLRPDITFYTESGKKIIVEITVGNPKPIAEYFNRWERLGDTVLEVRLSDNKDAMNSELYEEDIDFIEQLTLSDYEFKDKRVFRYLYSPVLNNARRDVEIRKARLADLMKERGMIMKIKELEEKIKELNSEKNILADEVQELEWSKDRLSSEVEMLECTKTSIERDNADMLHNATYELKKVIETLKNEKEALETSIDTLHERNRDIKNKYDNMNSEFNTYKNNISSLSQENAKLERRKISLEKEISLLESRSNKSTDINTVQENKGGTRLRKKEVDSIDELNNRLLEIKEDGLYGDSIIIKCKAMIFDNSKKILLYDESDNITLLLDEGLKLPEIKSDTLSVFNLGIHINENTKKDTILFLKIENNEVEK